MTDHRQSTPMVTKKPKGLGLGLEALLGPRVADTAPADASRPTTLKLCLLYTSDAADERSSVDLGGRRIIKKQKN